MTDLLIRNLDSNVINRLKLRARLHHRSLQGELRFIIETATKMSMQEAKKASKSWHKRLSGGKFSDSAELLRKDRER